MIIHKHFSKSNNDYNWYMGCSFCGLPFKEDEDFARIDMDVSWMRGDDEVRCYHQCCFKEATKQSLGSMNKVWELPDKSKTAEEIEKIKKNNA